VLNIYFNLRGGRASRQEAPLSLEGGSVVETHTPSPEPFMRRIGRGGFGSARIGAGR